MAIKEHPPKGTILLCDFTNGFKNPEMDKKRPVVVLTPKIKSRPGLCTVVSLSTSPPDPVMPYHAQIDIPFDLPKDMERKGVWVKGDMVNAVGFHRLDFLFLNKDRSGKRIYQYKVLDEQTMKKVHKSVLHGLGLSSIVKHL